MRAATILQETKSVSKRWIKSYGSQRNWSYSLAVCTNVQSTMSDAVSASLKWHFAWLTCGRCCGKSYCNKNMGCPIRYKSCCIWWGDLLSREQLVGLGWSETTVGCAAERDINVQGGLVARRIQYSLKHIGATTINKSMGATLPYGIAAEILETYSPWESGQIVVVLNRSESSSRTIIVGDQTFAINKIWELITTGNQWTRYTKHILDIISVNGKEAGSNQHVFDYRQMYPFCQTDGDLPSNITGYVYYLVSKPKPHRIYIKQTKCLTQRFLRHQSGTGSQGTHDPRNQPWAIGAYMCGLLHMKTMEQMSSERS